MTYTYYLRGQGTRASGEVVRFEGRLVVDHPIVSLEDASNEMLRYCHTVGFSDLVEVVITAPLEELERQP